MTPKEKAEELVKHFRKHVDDGRSGGFYSSDITFHNQKQCALICVDEIMNLGLLYGDAPFGDGGKQFHSYWQQVKTEIEKL